MATERASSHDLDDLTQRMIEGLDIRDRTYRLKRYTQCFTGDGLVAWMLQEGVVESEEDALTLGNIMLDRKIFQHVTRDHPLRNAALFYRFAAHEKSHGEVPQKEDGSRPSWADLFGPPASAPGAPLQPTLPSTAPAHAAHSDEGDAAPSPTAAEHGAAAAAPDVKPLDEHNVALLDNVHPREWRDPEPEQRYNLVVIGAGSGGLVTAAGAAGVGAKVALIEEHLMGGDCLNVGCVPSKALIRCARAVHEVRSADRFGVKVNGTIEVDFPAIMERMRRLRASISHADSAYRFSADLGVDVYLGRAQFTGPQTVVVNGRELRFAKAVVATGGSPRIPPIPGLAAAPYYTNATVFNLTELPRRMAVIGGGPIGLELAQAFRRFGAEVSVLLRGDTLLPKEDADAAAVIAAQLQRDGIRFLFNTTVSRVETSEDGGEGKEGKADEGASSVATLHLAHSECPDRSESEHSPSSSLEVDAILVATGRTPKVSGLGLDAAGVEYTDRGVTINDAMQTTNKRVYAVGDICSPYQFTHVSDFMARGVIRNALFFGREKFSAFLVPWCTYTEPEVAHVGLYERDLQERGVEYKTFQRGMGDVDRAILEDETEGFVKIHTAKGSDSILGATIVASNAGDMISEVSVAMRAGMGLGTLASVIHPYPTQAEAVRQAGDMYNKTRLTPTVKNLLRNLVALQR